MSGGKLPENSLHHRRIPVRIPVDAQRRFHGQAFPAAADALHQHKFPALAGPRVDDPQALRLDPRRLMPAISSTRRVAG